MSYCRFSDLNGYSDLYCYFDVYERYVCNVAFTRLPPGCPEANFAHIIRHNGIKSSVWDQFRFGLFAKQNRIRREWLSKTEHQKIDHPLAGAYHSFDDIRSAITFIQHLINEGFTIPPWVIPDLIEEMEELNSQGVLL